MSHKQARFSAAFLFFAVGLSNLSAAFPEPVPPYSRTEASRVDASLHAISFFNAQLGIAAGDHGTILRTDNGGLSWHLQPSPVACRLNEVVWVNEHRVVAVGGAYDRITNLSRGVVILSDDGGRQWRRAADQELPKLNAITLREDRVLTASGDWSDASLTNQFNSRDGGATWQSADPLGTSDRSLAELTAANQLDWVKATGHHAPIRAVDQVGSKHVWAVADHGVILHSEDGGQSWFASRGEGRQAAIFMISSDPSSIAWSILGKESLEMRNRVSALVLNRTDPMGESRALETARQVAAMLGAAGLDSVTRSNTQSPSDAELNEIVDWIAVHRPAVVLLDARIADELRTPIIEASVSLEVGRVVEYSFSASGNERGDTMLHHAAMLANSGILAGDLNADALHWIAPQQEPPLATILRRRYDSSGAGRTGESVTASIPLKPSRIRAADDQVASRRQLQIVQARMSESKRLEQLLLKSQSTSDFLSAFRSLLDQTAHEDRFRLFWNSLRLATRHGDQIPQFISMHQAILDEAVVRFGNTSAGQWSALRRDAITHSSEWSRLRDSQRHAIPDRSQVVTASADIVPVSPFQISPAMVDESRLIQASATIPVLVPDRNPSKTSMDASDSPNRVAEIDLSWEFHPAVLLVREAARQRGDDGELQSAGGSANLSRLAAYRSQWTHLLGRQEPGVIHANQTPMPPRLDGLTDDPCWASTVNHENTQTQVAYDEKYVYVLVRKPAGQLRSDPLANRSTTKVRDQDLNDVDRVQLRIDTDTDLLTSMQFQFTDAGRTHDSIDGFAAWQPTWYVAAKRTNDQVNIELAILRRDLTELPIQFGESWFISARTLAAGVEPQTQPIPVPSDWARVVFR